MCIRDRSRGQGRGVTHVPPETTWGIQMRDRLLTGGEGPTLSKSEGSEWSFTVPGCVADYRCCCLLLIVDC
eukprot:1334007-Pyramimonas_sp.AAC.1